MIGKTLLAALCFAGSLGAQELQKVKRICIEELSGDRTAAQIRDMIIAALHRSNAFQITENAERADAVLKGSAEDLVFTEVHQSSDGVTAHLSMGSIPGTTYNRSRQLPSASVGDQESDKSSERRHEAFAAVRLVNKEGDVIWSTTQESLGAKFRGASADVADKVMKQLLSDIEKAKKTGP